MSVRKRLAALQHKNPEEINIIEPTVEENDQGPIDNQPNNTDVDSGQAEASSSSPHPGEPPNFFRHLSVPEEDKHDQYNRRQKSSSSISIHLAVETPEAPQRHESSDSGGSGGLRRRSHHSDVNEAAIMPRTEDDDDDDASSSQDEADFDEHAFDHPSTYKQQPCIWIPKDTLGLSALLVNDLRAARVKASDAGAAMDQKGIVEVIRSPPDKQWYDGDEDKLDT